MTLEDQFYEHINKSSIIGFPIVISELGNCSENSICSPKVVFNLTDLTKVSTLMCLSIRFDSMKVIGERYGDKQAKVELTMSDQYVDYCRITSATFDNSLFKEYKEKWLNDFAVIIRLLN